MIAAIEATADAIVVAVMMMTVVVIVVAAAIIAAVTVVVVVVMHFRGNPITGFVAIILIISETHCEFRRILFIYFIIENKLLIFSRSLLSFLLLLLRLLLIFLRGIYFCWYFKLRRF